MFIGIDVAKDCLDVHCRPGGKVNRSGIPEAVHALNLKQRVLANFDDRSWARHIR